MNWNHWSPPRQRQCRCLPACETSLLNLVTQMGTLCWQFLEAMEFPQQARSNYTYRDIAWAWHSYQPWSSHLLVWNRYLICLHWRLLSYEVKMLHHSPCYWRVKWDNTCKPLSPVTKKLFLPLTHPAVIHMVAIQTTIRSSLSQAMLTVALGDRKSLSYSSQWTGKAAAAEWQEKKTSIPVHHPPWQMERLRANARHTSPEPKFQRPETGAFPWQPSASMTHGKPQNAQA